MRTSQIIMEGFGMGGLRLRGFQTFFITNFNIELDRKLTW